MAENTSTEKLESVPFLDEPDSLSHEKFDFPFSRMTRTRQLKNFITNLSPVTTHILVLLASSAVWGVVTLLLLQDHGNSNHQQHNFDLGLGHTIFAKKKYTGCGFSIEEAKSLGCEYDMLANHFVHNTCYDPYSVQEYQDYDTTWIGYTDRNWTEVLPSTQAMGESDVYWTNQRDHIIHCATLWKRQWRAFTEDWRYFDSIIADKEHTYHCAQFLIDMTDTEDSPDWREVPISVEVGFAGCIDRAEIDPHWL